MESPFPPNFHRSISHDSVQKNPAKRQAKMTAKAARLGKMDMVENAKVAKISTTKPNGIYPRHKYWRKNGLPSNAV